MDQVVKIQPVDAAIRLALPEVHKDSRIEPTTAKAALQSFVAVSIKN